MTPMPICAMCSSDLLHSQRVASPNCSLITGNPPSRPLEQSGRRQDGIVGRIRLKHSHWRPNGYHASKTLLTERVRAVSGRAAAMPTLQAGCSERACEAQTRGWAEILSAGSGQEPKGLKNVGF
jgi:hypothetical protein